MFAPASSLLATFARSDASVLVHAQLTANHLTVRSFSWKGMHTERIALSTLTGVEYFCESPRETGLTLHVTGDDPLTLYIRAARLWLLTLAEVAPHLVHQGGTESPSPEPLLLHDAPEHEPTPEHREATDDERVVPPAMPLPISEAHAAPMPPVEPIAPTPAPPRPAQHEPNLADGWSADRMTRVLSELSSSEPDRRSQALLRSLEWSDS